MSNNEEACELKAGHLPAVKVGGMRVAQHKPATKDAEKEIAKSASESGEQSNEGSVEPSPTPPPSQPPNLLISGVLTKGNADFPPEAVKAFHEKPAPIHDFRPTHAKQHIIQQPRK